MIRIDSKNINNDARCRVSGTRVLFASSSASRGEKTTFKDGSSVPLHAVWAMKTTSIDLIERKILRSLVWIERRATDSLKIVEEILSYKK